MAAANRKDMVGKRFGFLKVVAFAGTHDKPPHYAKWLCECGCGKEAIIEGRLLRSGNTRSCGCMRRFHSLRWFSKAVKTLAEKRRKPSPLRPRRDKSRPE